MPVWSWLVRAARTHWVLWVLLAAAAYGSVRAADHTLLIVEGRFPAGYLAVYWAGHDQSFADARSRLYATLPDRSYYVFLLPGPRELRRLRVDPPEQATGTVARLSLYAPGRRPIEQSPAASFDRIEPLYDVRLAQDTDGTLGYAPTGNDPQLLVHVAQRRSPAALALSAIALLVVLGALAGLYAALHRHAAARGSSVASALVSPPAWLVLCMGATTVYYLLQTPFHEVLRKDAVYYLLTGIRMTFGDIIPLHQHNTGWPMVLAAGLKLTGIDDYPHAMVMARVLSLTLVVLWLVPFYFLCRRLCTDNGVRIALPALALSPWAAAHSHHALSEPLYVLLGLIAFNVMLGAEGKPRRLLLAAAACGLASYARPDGLFLLGPVLLLALWSAWHDRRQWVVVPLVPVVFFTTAIFHLLPRFLAFGSPFNYGENSKYFVEGYHEVWAPNIPAPTLWQYLSSHSLEQIWDKFFSDGFLHVLWSIHVLPGGGIFLPWPYLVYAGVLYFFVFGKDRRIVIFLLAALAYIVGLTPVAQVYDDPGHCIVLLAPMLLIGAKTLAAAIDALPRPGVRAAAVAAAFTALVGTAHFHRVLSLHNMHWPFAPDAWATWAAASLEGKVAIVEGGDLIDIRQPWERLGRFNMLPAAEKARVIQPFRPGRYPDLASALADFRRDEVRYVMVDRASGRSRPYLLELLGAGLPPGVTRLAGFEVPRDGGWIVEDMTIFRVDPAGPLPVSAGGA